MLANAIQNRLDRNANLRLLKAALHDLDKGRLFTVKNTLEGVIASMELAAASESFTVVPNESDDVAVAHV